MDEIYVSSAHLQLKMSAFNKSSTYVHAVVSHELGHTLDFLHSSDPAQLMHATVDSSDYAGDATYKTGDRNGLPYLARNIPLPVSEEELKMTLMCKRSDTSVTIVGNATAGMLWHIPNLNEVGYVTNMPGLLDDTNVRTLSLDFFRMLVSITIESHSKAEHEKVKQLSL